MVAIDGVGLLQSDVGHDAYHRVLDLYDASMPVPDIARQVLADAEVVAGEQVDLDCLLAASIKALWEIGHVDTGLVDRLQRLTGSADWRAAWADAGADDAMIRGRLGVLTRLLRQIARPKARPRPRRRYTQVARLLFRVGDCLELPVPGGPTYRGVVGQVVQRRGRCEYVVIVMADLPDSTPESFRRGDYFGQHLPLFEVGDVAGPHVIRLDHAMLVREWQPLRVTGHLEMNTQRYSPGSWGGVMCMQDVVDHLEGTLRLSETAFQRIRAPLADLLLR